MKTQVKELKSQNVLLPRRDRLILLVAAVLLVVAASAGARTLAELYRTGAVDLELTFELGGDDVGDEDAIIFQPRGFALDSEGYIYIVANKLFCVKKFDQSGNHVLTFGREGEGPGEFRSPSRIVIDGKNRVVVFDFQNKRFQAFTTAGVYIDAWPMQEQVDNIEPAPGGGYYVGVNEFDFMDPHGMNDLRLLWMSEDFGETRTIDSTRVKLWENVTVGDQIMMATVPFPPSVHWALLPDGNLVVGRSDEYRLDILSPRYEKVGEIRRDIKAPPVTDEDKSEYFSMFERDGQGGLSPELKNEMDFPRHKPYYDDIVVDWEGNILIRWGALVDDEPVYDAFGPDGKFIGRIALEGVRTGALFRGGYIYTEHREEDELPTVRRYAIRGASATESGP